MEIETILQNWQAFAAAAVPKDAGPAQRKSMEQCYYAGALGMFFIMTQQLPRFKQEHGMDASVKQIDVLREELFPSSPSTPSRGLLDTTCAWI